MHKATNIVNPFGFKKHAGGLSEPRSAISGTESRVWLRSFECLPSNIHKKLDIQIFTGNGGESEIGSQNALNR